MHLRECIMAGLPTGGEVFSTISTMDSKIKKVEDIITCFTLMDII